MWYLTDKGYLWSGGVEGVTTLASPPPPSPTPSQMVVRPWWIERFGIPEIWKTTRGNGVRVGVLDTGVEPNHPDLVHAIERVEDFTDGKNPVDTDGHGTHVCGILAAKGIKTFGVAPEIKLVVGKVMTGGGLVVPNLVKGLQWLQGNNLDVVSLSIEYLWDEPTIKAEITTLISTGVIVVCAAGNAGQTGRNVDAYPASYTGVISVGSIDKYLTRDPTSNRSNNLKLLAPGKEIESTWINGSYKPLSGTSQAAPFVAGIVALLLGKNKSRKKDLPQCLYDSADKYRFKGFDVESGHGIINPLNAYKTY